MSDSIPAEIVPIPDASKERIRVLVEQRSQITLALQATVETLAEVLGVPRGWDFDPAVGFKPPPESRPAAE
jgi:hypothetical protein